MNILERIISVVAPHECLVCGREGNLLCSLCGQDAFDEVPSRCYLCKAATANFSTCKKCRPKSKLKHVWVRTEYNSLAKRLVKAFKFDRAQSAALAIAGQMAESLPLLENYVIIPIPTASSRVRRRGYDHGRLLAKALAAQKKLPYSYGLTRHGQSRQVGAKRQVRLKQLKGAFRLRQSDSAIGEKILLVDDVLTTGTSLNEAAKVLKKAGAKEVSAAVFAQTK